MATYRRVTQPLTPTRVGLNSFWLLAARVAGQGLAVLTTIALARTLGEAAFGSFAFISAVVFIGNVFSTFGLDTLVIREVAAKRASIDDPTRSTVHAALFLQLALSLLFIVGAWFIAPSLPNQTSESLTALRIALLSLIPLAFSTVYSAVLRGHEKMSAYMVFSIAAAAASAAGALYLYQQGGTLTGAAVVILVAQTGGAVVAWLLARPALPRSLFRPLLPSRADLRRAWRGGATLAALMVLAVLYQRSGVILLSLLDGDAAAGLYSAAARVLEAVKMLPAAVFGALLPALAAGRRRATRRAYRKTVAALLALSVMLAVLCAVLAQPIVLLLFGPEYAPAVAPLRVMSWSLPLTVMTFALSFNLVVRRQERLAAAALLLTLLAATALTGWMIGRWSLLGAAVALSLGEAIQITLLALATLALRRTKRNQKIGETTGS